VPSSPAGLDARVCRANAAAGFATWFLFHHESPLLHAYLVDNARCRLMLSMTQVHHDAPRAMQAVLWNDRLCPMDEDVAAGNRHVPTSVYLRAE
jgi:hypothetical protein